jgi:hypothetical protein
MDSDKSVTANFVLSDNTPPVSKIIDILSTTRSGSFMNKWLKTDTYTILVSNTDPGSNPSGIKPNSCAYFIYDVRRDEITDWESSRDCDASIELRVGLGLECSTEHKNSCRICLYSEDSAGNINNDNKGWQCRYLDIDITPPTTNIIGR